MIKLKIIHEYEGIDDLKKQMSDIKNTIKCILKLMNEFKEAVELQLANIAVNQAIAAEKADEIKADIAALIASIQGLTLSEEDKTAILDKLNSLAMNASSLSDKLIDISDDTDAPVIEP